MPISKYRWDTETYSPVHKKKNHTATLHAGVKLSFPNNSTVGQNYAPNMQPRYLTCFVGRFFLTDFGTQKFGKHINLEKKSQKWSKKLKKSLRHQTKPLKCPIWLHFNYLCLAQEITILWPIFRPILGTKIWEMPNISKKQSKPKCPEIQIETLKILLKWILSQPPTGEMGPISAPKNGAPMGAKSAPHFNSNEKKTM